MPDPDDRLFKLLRGYCAAAAITAIGVGCLVLCGWAFQIEVLKSVLPGLVAMKVNTALGLSFSGVSLLLLLPGEPHTAKYRAGRLLALLVTLIGAASLSEYLFHLNLGIDELLFIEPAGAVATSSPGRMAPTTASAFVAIGLALLVMDWKIPHGRRPAQLLSLSAVLLAMLSTSGYISGATALYGIFLNAHMALNTAIALLFLGSAVLLARPRSGLVGDFTGEGSGSTMARRFLPAVFGIPVFLGWIRLQEENAGLLGPDAGLAVYASTNVIVFAILVWLNARKMNVEYEQRSRAEVEIRELNATLEWRVADRTKTLEQQATALTKQAALLDRARDAMFAEKERAQVTLNSIGDGVASTDISGNITFLNTVAEKMTGWSSGEAAGRPIGEVLRVLDANTRETIPNPIAIAAGSNLTMRLPSSSILVRRDGSEIPIEDSVAPIHDRDGQTTGVVIVLRDVSAAKEMALQMAHSAQHDFLTGLPNRMLLSDRVSQAIALAPRHTNKVAVLFMDLDGFKHINDFLGHPTGDKLLQSVAKRLVDCVRDSDTVSRQGGDEFVVLLADLQQLEDAAITARRILGAVAEAHSIDQHVLHVTTSIGISVYPVDGLDADTLIKNADTAMYQAKAKGRQGYQFFKPAMNVRAVERQSIEEGLRRALERQELTLTYQPKVNLQSGAIVGAEALIRWNHPTRGLVVPAQFISVAEDSGLILPIGAWVLREACTQVRAWADAGLPAATVSVNVSAMEFRDERFLDGLFAILSETGVDPEGLELELTESVLMTRAESAASVLRAVRKRGVKVALDDFGTGYSSLSYLRRFPVDALKIDRSFVRQISAADEDTAIVTAVIGMARILGLRVVAEGVETLEELEFLRAHQCDEAQGYYFSRPLPAQQFARLLKAGIGEPPVVVQRSAAAS